MTDRDRPLYAVLIDADNIPARFAGPILKEITSFGEPALRRVYGDWSSGQLRGWTDTVRAHGLVAHQETANTKGKNASDIGLVIDAMDILHARRFDGFVLVSSDSDFTSLANRLREDGLMVIGIGEKKTPESLRNVCNRFIFIENLAAEPGEAGAARTAEKKDRPADATPMLLNAMERIDEADGWCRLGELGQAVMNAHPDFDTRTYGKSKLSDLVAAIRAFEVRREGNHVLVRHVKKRA